MIGIITYMDIKNKHGYILGADGIEYYFEFSSLEFLTEELYLNMEVMFDFYINDKIPYALDIKKN